MDYGLRPDVPADQLCGVTRVGATGIEWVCVREPHDPYAGGRRDRSRGPRQGRDGVYAAEAERHYMRPRWPDRDQQGC